MTLKNNNPCSDYPNDQSLFHALKNGEDPAWRCFNRRNFQKLFSRFVRKDKLCDEAEFEDVFQNGLLKFLRTGLQNKSLTSALDTYFFSIVHNSIIDLWRKKERDTRHLEKMRNKAMPMTEKVYNPDEHLHDEEMQQKLRLCIAKLPPRRQEILDLSFFHEKSIEEIIELMGFKDRQGADNLKSRAIKDLRQCLNNKNQ